MIILILFGSGWLFAGQQTSSQNLRGLEAAVRKTPGSAEARNALGTALGERGDLAGALLHLEEAVRLQPNYSEAFYNLGLTYLKKSKNPHPRN